MKKIIPILFTVLLIVGCKDSDDATGPTGDPRSLVNTGWELFEVGEYTEALSNFSLASSIDPGYTDATIGLGWANMRVTPPRLTDAINAFESVLRVSANSNDAQAGKAFALRGNAQYSEAEAAATVLLSRSTIWEFSHDESVNRQDLLVLRAACRFLIGNYATALTALQEVEPTFSVDVSTIEGRTQLGIRIEEWTRR
ncbi:MAG: hypothetical protein OEM52_02940 [bacterium]|nr:hypothetical protein [bacterium]